MKVSLLYIYDADGNYTSEVRSIYGLSEKSSTLRDEVDHGYTFEGPVSGSTPESRR